jgi:L-iditol 2-dehydrogenase
MKTALLTAPRRIELIDRELPKPAADEVEVRITQCGVCTSELGDWEGKGSDPLPAEIGHEIAGVVEAIGPEVSGLRPRDDVVVWVPGGGGFAERIVVPERFCVAVTAGLPYPAVAEPLACIVNAVELTAPALGDAVLIVGAGYMGNLLQMVTALKGPRCVIVADVREDARERARALGATRTVNPAVESLAQAVAQETKDDGVDVAYEVTGVSAGLDLVGEATRMSGKIAIVGYHQGEPRPIPLGRWNWMAFEIVNAHFRRVETIMAGMRAGMSLVGSGLLDPAPLVTDVFQLDEVADAFRRASMKTPGFVKAIVTME